MMGTAVSPRGRWKSQLGSLLRLCSHRLFGQHLTQAGAQRLSDAAGHHHGGRVTEREAFQAHGQVDGGQLPGVAWSLQGCLG